MNKAGVSLSGLLVDAHPTPSQCPHVGWRNDGSLLAKARKCFTTIVISLKRIEVQVK
jgi:hypothetical protein